MPLQTALIDSGPLIAYYNGGDKWHSTAKKFFEDFIGQVFTSEPVTTEVMWLLSSDRLAQNEFLSDLAKNLYTVESLESGDYRLIAELNEKYKDVPADFADLSIVALSVRLGIRDVVSLDSDFDIYRSAGVPFTQLFPKWD